LPPAEPTLSTFTTQPEKDSWSTFHGYLSAFIMRSRVSPGRFCGFTEWGVWSPRVEEVGYKTVAMLRGDRIGLATFMETPAQLFGETELLDCVAFLLQPILIGWDACYCPLFKNCPTDFLVKVSHDAFVDVIPADVVARATIQQFFAATSFKEAACRH
jgi:hypothetical protein